MSTSVMWQVALVVTGPVRFLRKFHLLVRETHAVKVKALLVSQQQYMPL